MTLENNGTSDVVPEIDTSAPAQETPEVAEPESNEAEQQPQEKPEQDDSDKSLKRLQRRIDRVTAARYQAEAEARHLRETLERIAQQQTQHQDEPQQVRPEDIDRLATEKAQRLREMESVSKRSTEIRDALVKEVGGERLSEVLTTVIEEAGPLAYEDGRWTPLGEAIADSDKPQKLLVYLSKNPEVAESLQGLSAARLGRRIEAIEREMAAPKVSQAPKPLKPVTPNGSPHGKAESEMTDAEWYRTRFKR